MAGSALEMGSREPMQSQGPRVQHIGVLEGEPQFGNQDTPPGFCLSNWTIANSDHRCVSGPQEARVMPTLPLALSPFQG